MNHRSVRPSQPSANRLLSIAAAVGAEAAVRLHIKRGDDLECRDRRGFTPLMIAASKNSASVCRLLLQAGVDVAAREPGGRNALDIARETGSTAAIEAIIECIGKPPPLPGQGHNEDAIALAQTVRAPWPSADGGSGTSPKAIPAEVPPAPFRFEVKADDASARTLGGVTLNVEKGTKIHVEVPASRECNGSVKGPDRTIQADSDEAFPTETDDTHIDSLFGDWEPVIASETPPDNPAFALAEAQRQQRINEHEPVEDGADWSDFEADLPEFAKPLPRENDAEYLAELRRILLLAAREGSVPRIAVEDLLSERGDAAARDQVAEAQLEVVIGELGAELDERLELTLGNESFKICVDPKESAAEEREVDEALTFFHELRSGRNDPLRIYMRSLAQNALLDGKREIAIAQSMEASVGRALDALARWPPGLDALLNAVAGAELSPAVLLPVVMTAREGADATDETSDSPEHNAIPSSLQSEDATEEEANNADTAFATEQATSVTNAIAAFGKIRVLTREPSPSQSGLILEQLRALSFRRTFLANLGDALPVDRSVEAAEYRHAISDLLASREEMVRGNLRLVYATAKRYLYSGIPLDDLIQEGNIGLLKAVDRFDWRRGYKFSTMAVWWIRQQIGRSTSDTAFSIRLPVHLSEKVSKQRQAAEAFERESGLPPTPLERASMFGISVQKMETLLRPSSEPIPIDEAPLHWDHATEELNDPMDIVANREVATILGDKLAALGRKTDLIIRMRFGIGVDGDQTLEQVGNVLTVTRERVRQIESKGIRHLSSASSREALAIALGRPLPKRCDSVYEKSSPTVGPPESTEPSKRNADIESLPPPVQRVLDLARLLGFRVEVNTGNLPLVILVEDVLPVDKDSRKLVADMIKIGFAHEPGIGYRL